MIYLIRNLLDRPLDPRFARAVVLFAIAITFSFAILVAFGVIAGSVPSEVESRGGILRTPPAPPAQGAGALGDAQPSEAAPVRPPAPRRPEQDPQDRPGSKDYRRARNALRRHRALQHLPYERGKVAIVLAGADHGRALVRVTAATVAGAKRAWRAFLTHYRDDGRAYRASFHGLTDRPPPPRGTRSHAARNGARAMAGSRSRAGGMPGRTLIFDARTYAAGPDAFPDRRPDGRHHTGSLRIAGRTVDRAGRQTLKSLPQPKARI